VLQEIVTGNAAQVVTSSTNGWVVGYFMPPGIAQSSNFEIKIWHYDEQPDYGQKTFHGTEFIIVEGGTLVFLLDVPDGHGNFILDQAVELQGSAREWVILPPGCKKQVRVLKAPAYGITVRWPSAPGMNAVVG